jgi:hypothetical protein
MNDHPDTSEQKRNETKFGGANRSEVSSAK